MNAYMQILVLKIGAVTKESGVIQSLKTGRRKLEENILQIPGPKMLMNTSTTKPLFLGMDGFAFR